MRPPTKAPTVRRWTDEDLAALRRAYAGSGPLCLSLLALRFGRTEAAVALKASRLGLADQCRPKRLGPPKDRRKFATPEEAKAAIGAATKARIAENGHPRGFLGRSHAPEARAAIADRARRAWSDPASALNSDALRQKRSDALFERNKTGMARAQSAFSRAKKGTREDLGMFFRSRWEANYARFLNLLVRQGKVASWAYEAHTFVFEAIKRGTRSYTPDFKVTYPDGRVEWHEVKGWLDQKGRTRLERMARYYPSETVVVIGEAWFKSAVRSGLAGALPHWETKE